MVYDLATLQAGSSHTELLFTLAYQTSRGVVGKGQASVATGLAGWLATAFFINLVVIEEAQTKIKSTCNSPNPCNTTNCQCTGDDGNLLFKKTVSSPPGRQAGRKDRSHLPSIHPFLNFRSSFFTHYSLTDY